MAPSESCSPLPLSHKIHGPPLRERGQPAPYIHLSPSRHDLAHLDNKPKLHLTLEKAGLHTKDEWVLAGHHSLGCGGASPELDSRDRGSPSRRDATSSRDGPQITPPM